MAAAFSMQPLSLKKIQKRRLCSEAKNLCKKQIQSVPPQLSMRKGVESVPSFFCEKKVFQVLTHK